MAEAGSVAEAAEKAIKSMDSGEKAEEQEVETDDLKVKVKVDQEDEPEGAEESEDKKEEEEDESDEVDDNAIATAILEGLRTNPEATIKQLAEELNISLGEKTEDKTAKEVKQEVKDIKGVLKENLGEFYDVIGESLGNALEVILTDRVESRFNELGKRDRGRIVNNELQKLETKDKIKPAAHSKILDKMHTISNQMPPAPGLDEEGLREYTRNIYTLASNGVKSSKAAVKRIKKIEQNAEDAEPASSDTSEQTVRKSPGTLTIRQAVSAATRNQRLK